MNKNLVYMVAIDHDKSQYKHSDFSQFSVKSWKYWCKKNNVDLHIVTKHKKEYGFPIWNKLDVCEVGKGYDKIAIVDCDTMIKWDAPNIFEQIETGIYGINDTANLRWVYDSVNNYGGEFFPNFEMNLEKYINAGVVYLDNSSLSVYDKLRDFYFKNKEKLDSWNRGGGKEQTLFNFVLQTNDYDVKLLPPIWNLVSMHKTELFGYNWQDGDDTTPFFIKYGYVWHFTGFEIEKRFNMMRDTWRLTESKYA